MTKWLLPQCRSRENKESFQAVSLCDGAPHTHESHSLHHGLHTHMTRTYHYRTPESRQYRKSGLLYDRGMDIGEVGLAHVCFQHNEKDNIKNCPKNYQVLETLTRTQNPTHRTVRTKNPSFFLLLKISLTTLKLER